MSGRCGGCWSFSRVLASGWDSGILRKLLISLSDGSGDGEELGVYPQVRHVSASGWRQCLVSHGAEQAGERQDAAAPCFPWSWGVLGWRQ